MKKNTSDKEILDKARKLGETWLAAQNWTGKHDPQKALKTLEGRHWNGTTLTAIIARDPAETAQVVARVAAATLQDEGKKSPSQEEVNQRIKELQPRLRIWDYYLMAFYESAMRAAGIGHHVTDQSLLPAFEAGVGFILHIGRFIIGCLLPEAHRDDEMRIHRSDGPAVVWGEDKQYWWHGVRVPEAWITGTPDPAEVLQAENVEQRLAGVEILGGWSPLLEFLEAKTIATHPDPMIGTIIQVDLPGAPGQRFLQCLCGTGRTVAIAIGPEETDPEQANARSFGLTIDQFRAMQGRS